MSKRSPVGTSHIFDQKITFVRPALPSLSDISGQVGDLLSSGVLTKGHHLHHFEELVAEHLRVKHAVGVSSCTAGLMLTYQALGLEGEAVVPSFTFMATVNALRWCGVQPVFADVNRAP